MPQSRAALEAALADRWTIAGEWSEVGARSVVSVRDRTTGNFLRVTALVCAADGMATAQLAREINALECLAHQPIVVTLLASGRVAGWLYHVTPQPAPSLRSLLERDGPMTAGDAMELTIAVADLLHFAHGLGFAHGAVSAESVFVAAGAARLGNFASVIRLTAASGPARGIARDVYALAGLLFESLTTRRWKRGSRIPDTLPDTLQAFLRRALSTDRNQRFTSAIAFAQALCVVRDAELETEPEVSARALLDGEVADLPLSDAVDRSLRVLHALLDRAEVADLAPEPDDPLVVHCWQRASTHVRADDARLVALRCRWRLLADRDPAGALSASQLAPHAAAVLPYRARALAALGRAAEARTLAVRSWFDDVALDMSALRSMIIALLLTRAFDLASQVSAAECAQGVDDPVIIAVAEAAIARGAARPLTPSAQTRTLRAISSAIDRRVPWTAELLVDPRWDGLRADHRFAALLARAKASWTT